MVRLASAFYLTHVWVLVLILYHCWRFVEKVFNGITFLKIFLLMMTSILDMSFSCSSSTLLSTCSLHGENILHACKAESGDFCMIFLVIKLSDMSWVLAQCYIQYSFFILINPRHACAARVTVVGCVCVCVCVCLCLCVCLSTPQLTS